LDAVQQAAAFINASDAVTDALNRQEEAEKSVENFKILKRQSISAKKNFRN
jgi:hypothetical protein